MASGKDEKTRNETKISKFMKKTFTIAGNIKALRSKNDHLLTVVKDKSTQIETLSNQLLNTEAKLRSREKELTQCQEKELQLRQEHDTLISSLDHREGGNSATEVQESNRPIEDLSDRHRPTRLAELFNDVYKCQWPEAMKLIENELKDREQAVDFLRNLLCEIKCYCDKKARDQIVELQAFFLRPDTVNHSVVNPVKEQLKCNRRQSAEHSVKELCKTYWSFVSTETSECAQLSLKIKPYIEECFKICWLMAVHDPPIVLGSIPLRGEAYDKIRYTTYKQSGSLVEFVVWPPLYLYVGGPILCKGIAQGCEIVQDRKPALGMTLLDQQMEMHVELHEEREANAKKLKELEVKHARCEGREDSLQREVDELNIILDQVTKERDLAKDTREMNLERYKESDANAKKLKNLEVKHARCEDREDSLQREVDELNIILDEVTKERDLAKDTREMNLERYKESEANAKKLKNLEVKHARCEDREDSLQREVDELNIILDEVTKERDLAKDTREMNVKLYKEIETNKKKLKELHAISKDRDNCKARYQEKAKQLKELENKHADCTYNDTRLKEQIDTLEGNLVRMKTERDQARDKSEMNLERYKESEANAKKLKNLEVKHARCEDREDSLQREVDELNIILDQVTKERDLAKDKRTTSSPNRRTSHDASGVVTRVKDLLYQASENMEDLRAHMHSSEVGRGTEGQNELADKYRRLKEKFKIAVDELKRCREENNQQKDSDITKHYEDTIQSYEAALKQQSGNKEKIQLQTSEINKLMGEIAQLTSALKKSEQELDDTKNRLIEYMRTDLTDINPSIADLTDQNRPTKLGERYSQLYDIPWTEAYEVLEEHGAEEQKIIEVLRDMLVNASKHCEDKANDQMQQLQHVFFRPEAKRGGNLDHVRKQLKDFRKASVEQTAKEHFESYWSDLKKQTSKLAQLSLHVKEYVQDCFTICWMMAVQDPPVVLGSIPERGNAFDKTLFREYTQSGPIVEFVVWPPLFLHLSGPILSKGVAQGYGSTRTRGTRSSTQKDAGYQTDARRPTTVGGREGVSRDHVHDAASYSSGDRRNYGAGSSGYGSHSEGTYEYSSRSPEDRQYAQRYTSPEKQDLQGYTSRSSKYNEAYLSGKKTPEYKHNAQGTTTKLARKSPSELPGITSQNVRSPSRYDMQCFHKYCKEGGIKYAKQVLGEDMYSACLFRYVSTKKY